MNTISSENNIFVYRFTLCKWIRNFLFINININIKRICIDSLHNTIYYEIYFDFRLSVLHLALISTTKKRNIRQRKIIHKQQFIKWFRYEVLRNMAIEEKIHINKRKKWIINVKWMNECNQFVYFNFFLSHVIVCSHVGYGIAWCSMLLW